ncbi:uncharacterized protein LOC141532254 [Cotesia typhae]|uniref:uncharacterized protein LOC141532254 n=1 Tax=Cotesia typhae TaxID=2053667 RepID=UPI003D695BB0
MSVSIYNSPIVIIDFNGYYDPSREFTIRELYIVSLTLDPSERRVDKHIIFKEWRNWKEWPKRNLINLKKYLLDYGIPLHREDSYPNQKKYLMKILNKDSIIFVETTVKKIILRTIIGKDYDIESLSTLKYQPDHKRGMMLACQFHTDEGKRNCARAQGILMRQWFSSDRNQLAVLFRQKHT